MLTKFLNFNNPYYWLFIFVSFTLILILYKSLSIIIGKAGEHWAKAELKKLPKDKYKVLNDVMLELNGITHQIDHIVISTYGIFVIETKQYNGKIVGNKYDKKWVRKTKRGNFYYTNPIRQNYGHVKTICDLLNLDESVVYNIAYIPSTAILDIKHDGEVVRADELCKKIYSYQDIELNNIEEIVSKINQNNITDKKRRKEHVKYLKNNIEKLDETMCPRCGSKLKERKGKYNYFYGCSNYPKCRYTARIK